MLLCSIAYMVTSRVSLVSCYIVGSCHAVHENRKSTCDRFVTLAAAVLSGPIIA